MDDKEPGNLTIARSGAVAVITINRPHVRNAVDRATAHELYEAFVDFDDEDSLSVAVLTGSGGTFCAGADLRAIATSQPNEVTAPAAEDLMGSLAPMGASRLELGKPVIAAIEGYAVAGGLELAIWADLRIAGRDATLGVFCRRWGVPLIDGGTIRLPRLIGEGRALDLILTGRGVSATEAHTMGLVDRVTEPGGALDAAVELATEIARHPQECMRADRASARGGWGHSLADAMADEARGGIPILMQGLAQQGARAFTDRSR